MSANGSTAVITKPTQDHARAGDRAVRVADRRWFKALARAGIAARGVIYLLLGYLAGDIAVRGRSSAPASSQGALEEVARQPAGSALLVVLAVGLGGYGLWRLSVAVLGDPANGRRGAAIRLGSLAAALIYFGLCARAVELVVVGHASSGGTSSNPQPLAAKVLSWSHGARILEVAGIVVIVAGVALAIWGVARDLAKVLATERMTDRQYRVARWLGALGDAARGGVVALVGVYVLQAGRSASAAKVKGVDAALRSVAHQPAGTVVLFALAVGLACFGAYSFFEARYRRV